MSKELQDILCQIMTGLANLDDLQRTIDRLREQLNEMYEDVDDKLDEGEQK